MNPPLPTLFWMPSSLAMELEIQDMETLFELDFRLFQLGIVVFIELEQRF